MREFINWIRSLFCKHDFEYEEEYSKQEYGFGQYTKGTRVSRICKKCGWHKSYWKY